MLPPARTRAPKWFRRKRTPGDLKIGKTAFDLRTNYRGVTANHLIKQVCGFHAYDKEAYFHERMTSSMRPSMPLNTARRRP